VNENATAREVGIDLTVPTEIDNEIVGNATIEIKLARIETEHAWIVENATERARDGTKHARIETNGTGHAWIGTSAKGLARNVKDLARNVKGHGRNVIGRARNVNDHARNVIGHARSVKEHERENVAENQIKKHKLRKKSYLRKRKK
jgi:hypothetical protein